MQPSTRPDGARANGGDWPLRLTLVAALAVLVITSVVVVSTHSTSIASTPPSQHHSSTTARTGRSTTKTKKKTKSPTVTASTVSGAFSGPVTLDQAGHGCGLSLASAATSHRHAAGSTMATDTQPVGHCTVLEVGDSIGDQLSWGLTQHLSGKSGLNLVDLDKSATGLANTSQYNWLATFPGELAKYHPQLVLVSLGGNDEQNLVVNGSVVTFGTPPWKSAYLGLVRHLVSDATASGAYVLWVGLPIMSPTIEGQTMSYSQGMAVLDSLYQEAMTSEPNATFVPTWSLFSDPEGQYETNAAVNGQQTTLRDSDGIHYSIAGAEVAGTYVIRKMALVYHVALAPTTPSVITSWG